MIKTVNAYSISDVFSNGNDKVYKIPKYQREYTWGIRDWDSMFDDITENESGYFLGSFICVSTSAIGTPELELIDGQQRFTSLTLLLAALYSKLLPFKENGELDDDDVTDVSNLRNAIANRKTSRVDGKKVNSYSPKLVLQDQNYNRNDYESLLHEKGIIDFREAPAYRGVRRVEKAFKHFCKCIDRYIEDQKNDDSSRQDCDILFELSEKFKATVLVGIEVDNHKDAYMLFESLNNRGVPLSAVDLIKNILICEAEAHGKVDECYEQWKSGLAKIGDDNAVQERFFRQYYNAFRDTLNDPFRTECDGKKYPLSYKATKSTILDIYEKLVRKDYSKFINNFVEMADYYSIIVGNSTDGHEYDNDLMGLARIQGTPSYLLLLYLLSRQDVLELDDDMIRQVVNLLIKFFVRRNITDTPPTRQLDKIFMDAVDGIEFLRGNAVLEFIKDALIESSAEDEIFEKRLQGSLYDENDVATRFVLCGIESQHMTKEKYTDLWRRGKSNKYVWTIEHIFPEGGNIPDAWVEMIAGGDRDIANEYRRNYVHTLGNLTLTGYNQNLSNLPFEKKKDRTDKAGKDIGYKNGLYLNSDVVNEDLWTIDKIKSRTDKLVKEIMSLYAWDDAATESGTDIKDKAEEEISGE